MAENPFQRLPRFLAELKRRKVYRVAATYAVVGFVLIQVADLTFVRLGLPSWTVTFVIVLVAFGFPLSLVVAWAFEVTPEGVRRTPETEPVEESEASKAGTRTGYKVLIALGLVAAAVAGGWYLTGGGGESREVTEGTVAVLPFQVSGAGAEAWREGMVNLVSTGLDGAAGLRAIAARTVLATWGSAGPAGRDATTEEALAVAREVGARYALVGSATALASELRLAASIYSTTDDERLGQVEARGSPDSVTALVDELTRRTIGILAEETGEPLRSADLASVTTSSVDALKAYLEGQRHARGGDLDAAIEDYQAAIAIDSSFALPHAGIALSGFWVHRSQRPAVRRAYQLADQLPQRERRLVRALYLGRIERRTLAAADTLRRLTQDYPEDPSMWNSLGEFVAHEYVPRGVPEVEEAHRRAVELDPGHTAYYDHYVNPAFTLHHDSALAAERLEAMPSGEWKRALRVPFRVVFGGASVRRQALARYDSMQFPKEWGFGLPLFATPQELATRDSVLRRLLARDDLDRPFELALIDNDQHRGQIEEALADVRQWAVDADNTACFLADALTLGYPVPDSVAARYLDPDSLHDEVSPGRLYCTGFYLVERGRGDELEGQIKRLREAVDTTAEAGVSTGKLEATVRELRGYRAWNRGELNRAARFWNRSNESGEHGAIWRGDLYRNLDQLERAEGWYLAAWGHPVAHERLGQLYEEMGQPEKAAAAYRRFIAAWEEADPELQPRVEAARKRVQELTAEEAETDE